MKNMSRKNDVFEKLASKYVGDGNTPNMFFVSVAGKITCVFDVREDAIEYAESFYRMPVVIEDRLDGTTWENQVSLDLEVSEDCTHQDGNYNCGDSGAMVCADCSTTI